MSEPWIGPTARQTLGRLRDSLLRSKESPRHFYENVLIRDHAVDAVIVKDERISERHGPPVHWMPEIYRVFDDDPADQRLDDWSEFAGPIQDYITKAGARNVLLFFGTGAWYKGYDYFLKLAELDETSFALHAGAPERFEAGKEMAFDTAALRGELQRQGRLFETGSYVKSSDLVALLFGSIERFASTHRLTLSSGTVLQALEAGKPVLTPATGLIGWRTRRFGLGMTYNYRDEHALARQWQEFREIPAESYRNDVERFMAPFSRDAVSSFFCGMLVGA